MKKNGYYLILLVGAVLILGIVAIKCMHPSVFTNWGAYLSKSRQNNEQQSTSEPLYAVGKNAVITMQDIEQYQCFYELQGDEHTVARDKAISYAKQREALYQEAIRKGYTVTDQEVLDYLDNLKKELAQAENSEDIRSVIDRFPSEEAYWDYELTVYQKNLPIEKYVSDLEKEFAEKYYSGQHTDDDYEEKWGEYYTQLKKDLADSEAYVVVTENEQ